MRPIIEQTCPKCGKAMVKRTGKYGDFLGCSGFPNCKTILPINGTPEKKALKKIETPSAYQQAIFQWVLNSRGNAVIKATAGSGKTTVQEHVVGLLLEAGVPAEEIIYLVYNSHVAREALEKGLPAKTTHQLGLSIVSAYVGKKVKVDEDKVNNIIKNLIQRTWDDEKWMISPVSNIVSKLKNTLAPWDNESQDKICSKFGIEVNGSSERIFELVRLTMEESNKQLDNIDFDDMIYLPIKFKMPCRQYKWVLGDEVQDWNRVQIELIKKIGAGRVLCVGDENQSMYGFRGAAPDAMERLTEAFDAEILPLSISYRNPTSHVELINRVFPDIKHEKSPYAKQGEILEMSEDKMLGEVQLGDMVICRNNSPLVKPVFELIRQGVKAIILGRDIGKNLVALIERFQSKTVDELLDKLIDYRTKEMGKLLKAEKTSQAQALDDKVETIIALSSGCHYPYQIIQKVNDVFSETKAGVVFSTVHKAKGSEAQNVYILHPQLMPSKYAKSDEDKVQERNVMFVAMSRAKSKLVFVGGPAPSSFESEEMWEEDEDMIDSVLTPEIINLITQEKDWDLKSDPEKVARIKEILEVGEQQTEWGKMLQEDLYEALENLDVEDGDLEKIEELAE